MRFILSQGMPEGCRQWLQENVGPGNVNVNGFRSAEKYWYIDKPEFTWFFERIEEEIPSTIPSMDSNARYVPTITIKDEKKAMLFALRWL